MTKPITEWTLEGALREIANIDQEMQNRQFAFILGSGASFASGIPTGATLAKQWMEELHQLECTSGASFEAWLKQNGPGIPGLKPDNLAEFYPRIFERRFRDDRERGYAALENVMEGKFPSLGYSLLAEIIQKTRHKVVITTNFDNLVADALAIHAHQSPLVVAHESLTGFVRPQLRRPLVAKIHRDLFFNPKNDAAGVATLEDGWVAALRKLFQHFTPIVVGYGGNDGSLMDFLMQLSEGEIEGRPIWCYRGSEKPGAKAQEVLAKHKGIQVSISDFDGFMLRLAAKLVKEFDVSEIAARIEKLGAERAKHYRDQAEKLSRTDATENTDKKATSELFLESIKKKTNWWAWELEASAEENLDKKQQIYLAGLEQFPTSKELLGNYANFLADERKDFDAAEAFYKRAIEADPKHANNLGNYANFLKNERKDFDTAEAFYKRAIDADPKHANNLNNYANLLKNERKDFDAAEAFYKRAIEADPKHIFALGNYANFLQIIRKDFVAAEAFYKRAIEADPKDANQKANFSSVLLTHDSDKAHNQARELIKAVVHAKQLHQALAESLLYGGLLNDLHPSFDMHDMHARLKGALTRGYQRGAWDFEPMFEKVLHQLPENKQQLYRALGAAILDENKVKDLDAFPNWVALEAKDPFAPIATK